MKRQDLEHVLRSASAITGASEWIVIGSQAIHGPFRDPPRELTKSVEVDLFTLRSPEDAALVEGSIGELSPFHRTFGYYAHGVGPETATLAHGWEQRLVALRSPATGAATGLCLEANDLAASKLAAGRDKDVDFVRAMIRFGLADPRVIEARLDDSPLAPAHKQQCLNLLKSTSDTP